MSTMRPSVPVEGIILGCGSSSGVPRLGLSGPDWGACNPHDPKNQRTRCSALVRAAGMTILIDTSPDLRAQLLRERCGRIDAVLYTHDHADQIHGIDDLRAAAYVMRKRIPIYADEITMGTLTQRFGYCFETPSGSLYPPILAAHTIDEPFAPFSLQHEGRTVSVTPFAQVHGRIRSIGFRIGDFAYSSDVSSLDEEAFKALEGVDCWIVDALRDEPHPTHSHVAQSLEWIARIKPRHAILTNMHIDLDHAELSARLPSNVVAAYDGLRFDSGV
jgi:phosphoribosyl 1,2-cyclic phosphate phosphodiesterase